MEFRYLFTWRRIVIIARWNKTVRSVDEILVLTRVGSLGIKHWAFRERGRMKNRISECPFYETISRVSGNAMGICSIVGFQEVAINPKARACVSLATKEARVRKTENEIREGQRAWNERWGTEGRNSGLALPDFRCERNGWSMIRDGSKLRGVTAKCH